MCGRARKILCTLAAAMLLLFTGCGLDDEAIHNVQSGLEEHAAPQEGKDVQQTQAEVSAQTTDGGQLATVAPQVNVNVSAATAANADAQAKEQVIMIGDSRTVSLYCSQVYSEEEYPKHLFFNISEEDYTGAVGNTTFVAKGGEGFSWLQRIGLALAQLHINDSSVLVFWLGVNDTASIDSYAGYINGAALSYGIPVYYATLGPCDGSWSDHEQEVEAFNEALRSKLDQRVHIIDAFGYIKDGLTSGAMSTIDGLHYSYNTSRQIYQYILDYIAADNG